MALQALAIIGKNNEPLYLRDVDSEQANPTTQQEQQDDVFGFAESHRRAPLSLRKEFMIHASLDILEEAIGSQRSRGTRPASDSKWIGLLCPMEESYIYAYMTSTNVKILAMVSDSLEPSRQVHLRTLFAVVHNLFVEYSLNPWTIIQSKIESQRFEDGVQGAIRAYVESSKLSWA